MALLGREEELLAQLRALLFLPSPAPTATPPAAPAVKVESAGPLAAIMVGSARGGGRGPAAAAPSTTAAADAAASSCGGSRRRRRRQGSKRDRDDYNAKDEQHDDEPAAAQPHHYCPPPSCKRRKKKQQSSKYLVTSVPDFDGYQWRKYGQKQIEGAMYPRSYYRCTRSAEQGCAAKRTVQRNDDDGAAAAAAAAPEYTVVYVAEHTCTANDSLEAPVILETTTVVVVPSAVATNTHTDSVAVPTTSAGSCSTTATASITTGTESPAISGDDITCWSSTSDYSNNSAADDYYCGGLFAAAHGAWTMGQDSASLLQEMEDLTGPIRSPVHVPAAGWTVDQLLLQLVNEHVCHF